MDVHDLNAYLALACAPDERLGLKTYREGAVREFGRELLDEELFIESIQGVDPPGTQVVYLDRFMGQEPTLMMVTTLALEALEGCPAPPIDEENRLEYGRKITVFELEERRRVFKKQLKKELGHYALQLPIALLRQVLGCFWTLLLMPWHIWKVYRAVEEASGSGDDYNVNP